jgi:hypothetical protein
MRRTSVSLTPDQERAITEFSQPGPYRDELLAWARGHGVPVGKSFSEALLMRVLIDAGIEHFRTGSVEVVYTELAGIYVDEGLPHEIKALRAETGAADDGGAGANDARGGDGAAGGRVGARR